MFTGSLHIWCDVTIGLKEEGQKNTHVALKIHQHHPNQERLLRRCLRSKRTTVVYFGSPPRRAGHLLTCEKCEPVMVCYNNLYCLSQRLHYCFSSERQALQIANMMHPINIKA